MKAQEAPATRGEKNICRPWLVLAAKKPLGGPGGPKRPQDYPMRHPKRRPKSSRRRPKKPAPKTSQEAPKTLQNASKMPQDSSS